eukprot:CAMPEP_0117427564 /NCGR_PEP_ID=MMETSP0758-20121206/7394_1 /TAXON_ID=63605 /ORGANISM="Percolomonas cosmopolitus, Strain AE-1 (ATCC 50343)" /LENGTH=407 /DNA_ID=CAMNT_0005213291 /DNA_START=841 /DNA_END=2061 /DNA_ORIENTATION=+
MKKLEEIVWPEIKAEVLEKIEKVKAGVIIVEAAILIEAGWQDVMDETWCYAVPPNVAIERMVNTRGLNEEQAKGRLNAQLTNEERIKHATRVFWTDKDIEHQRTMVKKAYDEIKDTLIPLPDYGATIVPPFLNVKHIETLMLQAENMVNKGVYYILSHYPTIDQLTTFYETLLRIAPTHEASTLLLPLKNKEKLNDVIHTLPFIETGNYELFNFENLKERQTWTPLIVDDLNVTNVTLMDKIEEEQIELTEETYNRVCVGGTFDRLHMGHKLLLSSLVLRAKEGGTLVIGITTEELQQKKAFKELIEPFEVRVANVKAFINQFSAGRETPFQFVIAPLHEPFGPTITEDAIELLVVSEETKKGGEKVNEVRQQKQMTTLKLEIVPEIKGDTFHKISSSALRERDAQR